MYNTLYCLKNHILLLQQASLLNISRNQSIVRLPFYIEGLLLLLLLTPQHIVTHIRVESAFGRYTNDRGRVPLGLNT